MSWGGFALVALHVALLVALGGGLQNTAMEDLNDLLTEVAACRLCEPALALGARPVVQVSAGARLLVIGQAPGLRVHRSGVPWNDPSGDRLRDWLGLSRSDFYTSGRLAVMPMGFCYPGKGVSGDLPPRKECAPQWHRRLLAHMPELALTLLIGQYAQRYYAPLGSTLTERVRSQRLDGPLLCLPHPSPRNIRWFKGNPWFDQAVLPVLKERVAALFRE